MRYSKYVRCKPLDIRNDMIVRQVHLIALYKQSNAHGKNTMIYQGPISPDFIAYITWRQSLYECQTNSISTILTPSLWV